MAITRAWDETAPADNTLSNLLGQDIRFAKQDLRERMEDVLVTAGSWTASGPGVDPVVLPGIKGNVVGKKMVLHWSAFNFPGIYGAGFNATNPLSTRNTNYVQVDPGYNPTPLVARANIILAAGATMTLASFTSDKNGGTATSMTLQRIAYESNPGGAAVAIAAALGFAINGIFSSASAAFAELVPQANANAYVMEVSLNPGNRFYGAEIIYTTADSTCLI